MAELEAVIRDKVGIPPERLILIVGACAVTPMVH